MEVLYYISLVVFILYTGILTLIKGIPSTISSTAYILEDTEKLLTSVFTWFCWIAGGTLLPYWLDFRTDDLNVLIFIACGALLFVGAAPFYKEESQKMIHSVSALVCAISAYIWVILYSNIELSIISFAALILVSIFVKKNKGFWLEVIAFMTMYTALK